MGYYMFAHNSSIHIQKENFDAAFQAVKEQLHESLTSGFHTFEDILFDIGYEADHDENGNIIGVSFVDEYLTCDKEFWSAVAPFTVDGDFLEFEGEDYTHWRWVFKNGCMKEIFPTIIWGDDDA